MLESALHDRIDKLRIAGHVDDSLSFQLRLQSLLSPLSFGASPSAVVCIRAVRDPLPGSLRPTRHDLAGGREWSDAVVHAVEDKIRRADRARNATSHSEAVIFADHAELMACLVDDWLHGRLLANWWWQSFLRRGSPLQTLKSSWRSSPQYIPATLHFLSARGCATTVVQRLSASESVEFLNSIVSSFSLTNLKPIVDTCRATTALHGAISESLSPRAAGISAPWHLPVPETRVTGLEPLQEFFLGVALMIQRAPANVRSRRLASEVARWQRQRVLPRVPIVAAQTAVAAVSSPEAEASPIEISPKHLLTETDRGRQTLSTARDDRRQTESLNLAETFSPPAVPVISAASVESISNPDQIQPSLSQSPKPIAENTAQQQSHREIVPAQQDILPNPMQSIAEGSIDETAAEVSFETNLGGMFYLINLALCLKLYGDFTMPLATGLELNIWDFVSLVGAEMIGDAYPDDPLWSLLANLAGREEDEAAGSGFKPADEWRLPPDWLSPFENGRLCKWTASHGRLRVIHAEGFAILDLPLAKDLRAQLKREIEPYEIAFESLAPTRRPQDARSLSKNKRQPSIRRWLSLLMPYVRARLRVGLGLESDDDVAQILCMRPAHVRLTGAHVDVFFPLSDLPLQIRLAGLDRDPGWVPAAGRFIAFHFD